MSTINRSFKCKLIYCTNLSFPIIFACLTNSEMVHHYHVKQHVPGLINEYDEAAADMDH